MGDFIQYKSEEGILFGKITRPEKRNAVNYQVMDGFQELLDRAEIDRSVKAVVITGKAVALFVPEGTLPNFMI